MTATDVMARKMGISLGKHGRERLSTTILHIVLMVGGITMLIPFIWLVSTSLKQTGKEFSYPPQVIPDPVVWGNYFEVLFGPASLITLLSNTMIVTTLSVLGAGISSSLVSYGFARFTFPGRDFWFMVLLATMMLPGAVTIIPRLSSARSRTAGRHARFPRDRGSPPRRRHARPDLTRSR